MARVHGGDRLCRLAGTGRKGPGPLIDSENVRSNWSLQWRRTVPVCVQGISKDPIRYRQTLPYATWQPDSLVTSRDSWSRSASHGVVHVYDIIKPIVSASPLLRLRLRTQS